MADVTCDVGDFYDTVMHMYEAMVDEAEEKLTEDIYAAADSARDELKAAVGEWSQMEDVSDRERLTYEKGWTSYHHKMVDGHVQAVVANKTAPGLTHLIEFGHELFLFGRDTKRRTHGRKHIESAYENAARKYFGR